jgi:hypothetical protein
MVDAQERLMHYTKYCFQIVSDIVKQWPTELYTSSTASEMVLFTFLRKFFLPDERPAASGDMYAHVPSTQFYLRYTLTPYMLHAYVQG